MSKKVAKIRIRQEMPPLIRIRQEMPHLIRIRQEMPLLIKKKLEQRPLQTIKLISVSSIQSSNFSINNLLQFYNMTK